nr:PDZ domain-containing protein [Neorhizobium galegae]
MDGKLVGINSAIVAPSGGNIGIGFAIPVSMAKDVMDKLIKDGSIRRGRLGVVIQDLSPELAKALGVTADAGAVVSQVNGGSSAADSGLKAGDVIIAVDEDAIQNAAVLRNIVGAHAPSERVQIRFRRGKDELHVQATLSDQDRFPIPEVKKESLQGEGYLSGVVLASPDASNNPEGIADGAIVVAVEDNCAAADAGLQAGDIIVAINQKSIHSPMEVVRTAKQERDVLLLSVRRDGQTRFVAIGS